MALTVADLLVLITADAKGFEQAMGDIGKKLQTSAKDMEKFGKGMSTQVSLPLLAISGAAAKMAMDFNSSLTKMVVMAGVSREQVNAWRDDFERLSQEAGRSATELTEAMFRITSSGLEGSTALAALEASAKGAAIGMGETNTIAFAATSAINAYGLSAEDADKVVAQMMMTVRMGNMDVSTLAGTLGAVLPIAAELGIGLDQVGASIASMTRLGADAHMATTALRQVMATLADPTAQAKELLAGVGLTAADLRAEMRERGLLSTLMLLKERFKDNDEAIYTMFPNIRALTGVLNLTGRNIAATERITKALAETTGKDLNEAYEVVQQGMGHKFKQSLMAMESSMIQLGQVTLPPFIDAMQFLATLATKGAEALNTMSPAMKNIVLGIGGFLIALGPAAVMVSMFTKNIGWLITKLTQLSVQATTTAASLNAVTASGVRNYTNTSVAMYSYSTAATQARVSTLNHTAALQQSKVAMAANGLAFFALGYQVGTFLNIWISKWPLAAKAFGTFADADKDFIEQLATDQLAWDTNLGNYERMRQTLKLTGDEWKISGEQSKENAARLVELLPKIEAISKAKREEAKAIREAGAADTGQTEIMKRAQDYIMQKYKERKAAQDALVTKVREEYDFMTREEVLKQLAERAAAYKYMVDQKVSEQQIQDQIGTALVDDLTLLQQYKEPLSALPEETRKMLENLKGGNPELAKQVESLGMLGTQYESLSAAMKVAVYDPATGMAITVEEGLKHGFAEGTRNGLSDATQQMAQWVAFQKDVKVPIELTVIVPDIVQIVKDTMNGKLPPGGGALP